MWNLARKFVEFFIGPKEKKPQWTLIKQDGSTQSFKKRPMRMLFKRNLF